MDAVAPRLLRTILYSVGLIVLVVCLVFVLILADHNLAACAPNPGFELGLKLTFILIATDIGIGILALYGNNYERPAEFNILIPLPRLPLSRLWRLL